MTIKTSGLISISDVNVELGRGASDAINFNDGVVRNLLQVPSGQISLSNAYGKSSWKLTYRATDSNNGNTVDYGEFGDGAYLSAMAYGGAAVYITSNVACTWTISVGYSSRGSAYYSYSPSNGYTTSYASFSASPYQSNRFNSSGTNTSWSVTASYGGKSISFDVYCEAYGDTLEPSN